MSIRQTIIMNSRRFVAAVANIGFWYTRPVPNTYFASLPTYQNDGPVPLKTNTKTFLWAWNSAPMFIQSIGSNTGKTQWASNVMVGGAANNIGSTQSVSVANNDQVVVWAYDVGDANLYRMFRFYGANGTVIWSANTKDYAGIYGLCATDDALVRMGHAVTSSNNVISKWSTNGTTLDWYYNMVGAFNMGTRLIMAKNPLQNRFYVSGQWGTKPSIHCWDSTGAKKWGYTLENTTLWGIPYIYSTDAVDSSNNIYFGLSSFPRDFCKVADADTSATFTWRKAIPSGNLINYITTDIGGNCFVGCYNGANAYVTKLDSGGTASWTKRFWNTRPSTSLIYEQQYTYIRDIHATPMEVFITVYTQGQYDSGKSGWLNSGNDEVQILRIGQGGEPSSNTNHANLYMNVWTTMTITAQTAISISANTGPANSAVSISSNTVANDITFSTNTIHNILATAL